MNKLSAVIITFNEERNILRCLNSLRGVADEIIVVDSLSTDRTKEICLAEGAKVLEKKWEGYGNARNYGAAKAESDYVLMLDADEALTEELRTSIIEAKQTGLNGIYAFNRLTNYCGRWIHHCGWYPDKKVRMYNKHDAEWNDAEIHEKLMLKKELTENLLRGNLEHYSFYSVEEHKSKAKKYARLGALQIKKDGKKFLFPRMIFNPLFRFVRMYFLQRGFSDGYYGFRICLIASGEVFMKYRFALFSDK